MVRQPFPRRRLLRHNKPPCCGQLAACAAVTRKLALRVVALDGGCAAARGILARIERNAGLPAAMRAFA